MTPPAAICAADAASRVALSVATMRRLAARGQFPAGVALSPGRVGWRVADVDAWLARGGFRSWVDSNHAGGTQSDEDLLMTG
jgi:predicted DNA-binding transcriptional regulator AlpA